MSEVPAAKTFTPVDGGVNRACRGAHAGDNQGTYFVLRSADDIAGCKLLCEETAGCGGIEYHTSGRCEVWIRPDGVGASNLGRNFEVTGQSLYRGKKSGKKNYNIILSNCME